MIQILFIVVLVLAVALIVWQAITAFWIGGVVALAVVAWAKHAYPAIPAISYFQRKQRRWRLPALAFVAGAGAQVVLASAYALTARTQSPGMALAAIALGGAAATVCGYVVVDVLRGRAMKNIFDVAPIGRPVASRADTPGGEPAPRPEQYRAAVARLKFADLYGHRQLKERLLDAAKTWRANGKNGILFYGPPGTGKTAFAEALAGELGLPIIAVSIGDLVSWRVNETTENLVALFDAAAGHAPCMLLIDEVEAVIEDRSQRGSQTEESGRIVATFLARATALQHSQVLLTAATNYIDRLDPAAVREGRFDFKIEVPLPDDAARRGLIEARLAKAACSTDSATLARLSQRWAGFNVPRIIAVTDAACEAVKARTEAVGMVAYPDFYAALRRVQGAKAGAPEGSKLLADLILEPGQESRLREIADQLVHVDEIERAGATIPKGILFFGPPGTGKTATAMALAAESGWSFVQRNGRELMERSAIEKLRGEASDLRPAIVFIDEADDILADRQFSNCKTITNELLTLMDGAGGSLRDVVWVAATNRPDDIDEAALRAGRFEQKLEFGPPTGATARRMVLSWAKAHASRLDREADAWADAVLADLAGLTAANIFGALGIANNIAVTRARADGQASPTITPKNVSEAVGEITGSGMAALCT